MKTETHRPLIYIAGAFGLGILLSRFGPFPFSGLCLLSVALLVLGAGFSRGKFFPTAVMLALITGLGILHAQGRAIVPHDDIGHVARYYYRKPARIEGVIVSDVQSRAVAHGAKTTFTLNVLRIRAKWGWQKRKGKILVHIFGKADCDYGDRIVLEGKLHRPYDFSPGTNFSYRDYLARRDIRFILSVKKDADIRLLARGQGGYFKALSLNLRGRLKSVLSEHLSRNEAGVMKAILLGDRSGIPKPVRILFVQTGTAHILAISGLHMGIVAALFLAFVKILPVGRRWQLAAVMVLVTCYVFLTGGRPSVVRAAVMTNVFLASFIVEKEFDRLNTLALAAVLILLFNPFNLFDAGFQLSFSCVLAIIYAERHIRKNKPEASQLRGPGSGSLRFDGWVYYVLKSLYLSSAIWVAVAGIVAYCFGIITPVTILANIIVIPLISIIVALGFGLLSFGVLLPAWAFVFAECLKVVLNIMVGLIFLFGKVPFAYIYISKVSLWQVMVYYSAVLLVVLAVNRKQTPGVCLWFEGGGPS